MISLQRCSLKTTLTTLSLLLFLAPPSPVSSQTCQRSCGNIPLKYPFGSGPGCGDPRFQRHVSCNGLSLTLTTRSGTYPITAIDYSAQLLHVSDDSMSTCSCTRRSASFSLDWDAPFAFHDDTVFALLNCREDSPVRNQTLLCDAQGQASVCSFLSSCRAISASEAPLSSCCVYAPVDLGPAFTMDLEELKCGSYSGFYGFNGRGSGDPEAWKFGIALRYKFSVYDEFPSYCGDCERSLGFCGYDSSGGNDSFVCNCLSGLNTTSGCFFGYSHAKSLLLPCKWWHVFVYVMAYLLIWLV